MISDHWVGAINVSPYSMKYKYLSKFSLMGCLIFSGDCINAVKYQVIWKHNELAGRCLPLWVDKVQEYIFPHSVQKSKHIHLLHLRFSNKTLHYYIVVSKVNWCMTLQSVLFLASKERSESPSLSGSFIFMLS